MDVLEGLIGSHINLECLKGEDESISQDIVPALWVIVKLSEMGIKTWEA